MSHKAVTGIGQLVVSPIAETTVLMIEDRLIAGKINNHSADQSILQVPHESIVSIQHGQLGAYGVPTDRVPALGRLAQRSGATSVGYTESSSSPS